MEKWKNIRGYEGHYQVSNLGRVKSLSRISMHSTGSEMVLKEKILKTFGNKGYINCKLYADNIGKTMSVHRLVANSFIENPKEKLEVNHINGIKNDNRLENLEWCTRSENLKHAYATKTFDVEGTLKKLIERRVRGLIDMQTGIYYDSLKDSAASLGVSSSTLIDRLKGKSKIRTSLKYI